MSTTSCCWILQMSARSGSTVRSPKGPGGMARPAEEVAAVTEYLWMRERHASRERRPIAATWVACWRGDPAGSPRSSKCHPAAEYQSFRLPGRPAGRNPALPASIPASTRDPRSRALLQGTGVPATSGAGSRVSPDGSWRGMVGGLPGKALRRALFGPRRGVTHLFDKHALHGGE